MFNHHKMSLGSSCVSPHPFTPSAPPASSGKRHYRQLQLQQDIEDQFRALRIVSATKSFIPKQKIFQNDAGIVHMSVKVPFPDSTLDNDGRCQNLIGRILGPRGISVRQLEMLYGCKILIRGKGSIKVRFLSDSVRFLTP